ncbi:MAG: hypothetical protein Q9M39_09920 [Sulfurovum sp.]|nr:hypothetical protein [Sulfurovum sp.]
MKKYIIATLLFLGLFILSGCGSDNISDSGSGVVSSGKVLETEPTAMKITGDTFTTKVTIVKKVDRTYKIELSRLNLFVKDCTFITGPIFTPPTLALNAGVDSSRTIDISGTFAEGCTETIYVFSAFQETTKDGKVDKRMYSVGYNSNDSNDGGGIVPTPSNGFFNATTPLEVTQAGQPYEIKVQVIQDGYAASDKIVQIKSFDSTYGDVLNPSATTGEDGYAVFNYMAPAVLPANGTSTILELTNDENGTVIKQNIVLKFAEPTENSDYRLTNATTPLVVNFDNELKTISVNVVDAKGVGVPEIDVQITAVSGVEFGSIISASTIASDSSGRASFDYIGPKNLADVDGKTTTVTLSMLSNGVSVTTNVLLSFVKANVTIPVPIVVIKTQSKNITLTQNGQVVEMEIQVLDESSNAPYTQGSVTVSLPPEVVDGVDVGAFTEYIVPVNANGIAVFNYTGPQDLATLVANGNLNATFEFFHEDNPTQKEDIKITYDLQGGYIPANYVLTSSSSDGEQTMGLQILKTFTLYLKDDKGTLVKDEDITNISIESKNTLVGKLVDINNGGANVSVLTFTGTTATNSKSFPVQTYTLSGLLPIEVTVTFKDGNGDMLKRLTVNMNIVVFSGPPTAMSISYAGVEQNSTVAKYIEKFAVSVTDSYNNPVNTRPYLAVGSMVEYAVDGVMVQEQGLQLQQDYGMGRLIHVVN